MYMAVSGVARPQSGQSAAVFYSLGHPTPYTYEAAILQKKRRSSSLRRGFPSLTFVRHKFSFTAVILFDKCSDFVVKTYTNKSTKTELS
jgi:hypothetical protein